MSANEERNWLVFCHLGGIISFYFLSIIVPFVIWQMHKSNSDFIRDQGLEIVNFQISLVIYETVVSLIALTIIGIPITILGWICLIGLNIVCVIRGAISASQGNFFWYPFNLRLLK